jgi:hypothetical protein
MSRRRTALSLTAVCVLTAGGAAAWALTPAKVQAVTPTVVAQPVPQDIWAKGPVDSGNMVRGILDYRSDTAQR